LNTSTIFEPTGIFAGGEALQPPETAMTLYWKNGKVATTDGPNAEKLSGCQIEGSAMMDS
jgi:hypothetical protein